MMMLVHQTVWGAGGCNVTTPCRSLTGICFRWNWAMATDRFTDEQWRKSSQWSVLIRSHAQLVMQDREIESIFAAQCFTYLPTVKLALPAHVQARQSTAQMHALLVCVRNDVAARCSALEWAWADLCTDVLALPKLLKCWTSCAVLCSAPSALLQLAV